MVKKSFFKQLTKAEIKKKKFVEISHLIDVETLSNDEFTIIPNQVPRGYDSARKFMKHGTEVKLKRVYSITQSIQLSNTPIQLREKAFDSIKRHTLCGYTFLPLGRDKRKRKISLVECLEGVRIFAYSHQVSGSRIKVKPYSDSLKVRQEGAEVIIEVPSRTEKSERIQLKLLSMPFVDSPEKYGITNNLSSDHSCPSKRFNIRYRYSDDKEASGIFNLCCHEMAGNLELIQSEWDKNKNLIPLQMCQFAIPTQKTVDYYLRWERNILTRDEELKSEDKLRKPNRADKEIGLWAFVEAFGYDETFYSRESRDGHVKDYIWI